MYLLKGGGCNDLQPAPRLEQLLHPVQYAPTGVRHGLQEVRHPDGRLPPDLEDRTEKLCPGRLPRHSSLTGKG